MSVKKVINSGDAPEPVGPYSHAVICNDFIFTSGQIAINPKTNILVSDDIETQTYQVLMNLKVILEKAGSSMDSVIKTTIYLIDMNHFSIVNNVYENFFGKSKPARSTVEVNRLPKDVLVEIDCIASIT